MASVPEAAPSDQPVDEAYTEQCLSAIDEYLGNPDLGVYGDIPDALRQEWLPLTSGNPTLDHGSTVQWAEMKAELGFSLIMHGQIDDVRRGGHAFISAQRTLSDLTHKPGLSRLEKSELLVRASSFGALFGMVARSNDLNTHVKSLMKAQLEAAPHAMAHHTKHGDIPSWRYLNSLAVMTLLNVSFLQGDPARELIGLPAPQRMVKDEGGEYADATFMMASKKLGVGLGRLGLYGAGKVIAWDPLMLLNENYQRGGHPAGTLQALVDRDRRKGTAAPIPTIHVNQIAQNLKHNFGTPPNQPWSPETPEIFDGAETMRQWYMGHFPHRGIKDIDTLSHYRSILEDMNRLLLPDQRVVLGILCHEEAMAIAQTDAAEARRLFDAAEQAHESAASSLSESGQRAEAFEATLQAMAMPVYRAVMLGEADMAETVKTYKRRLMDTLAGMSAQHEQLKTANPNQAAKLDAKLQQATVWMGLVAEEAKHIRETPDGQPIEVCGGFVPLPATLRQREGGPGVGRTRRWDTTVLIADEHDTFRFPRAARFRLGTQPDVHSLDEGVFTVTPAMLRQKPGQHGMLQTLIKWVRREPINPDYEPVLISVVNKLENGTTAAQLL